MDKLEMATGDAMKTYATVIFTDKSAVTQWFPMSRNEIEDKLRPGRYLMRYGRPKMIAELDLICWDIGGGEVYEERVGTNGSHRC